MKEGGKPVLQNQVLWVTGFRFADVADTIS